MEKTRNLKRQIRDVISQADNLKRSQSFDSDYNNLVQYIGEMKSYINVHVDNKMVLERINTLPNLSYYKTNISILLLPLLPYYSAIVLRNYLKKKNALKQLDEVKSVFSSIEFLLGRN